MPEKPQFKSAVSRRLSFFDQLVRDKTLRGRAVSVAWRLVDRINDTTGECFPSINLLAKELNAGEKTIRRAIEQLIDRNWFEKKSRGRGGTLYFPNYEKRSDVTILNSKENRSPSSKKPVISSSKGGHTLTNEPIEPINKPIDQTNSTEPMDATVPANAHWKACESKLREEFGNDAFEEWIDILTPLADDGYRLVVAVSTKMYCAQIREHYQKRIEGIVERQLVLEIKSWAGNAYSRRREVRSKQ